ncbi:MAG: Type I phosphodiesterase / nucleotide pyrophosphatase [Candidatus Lokiarchaeum sp. GC14_75]|nr:MAG: Type I phosphodiesterase / nucleotide pyrophosphatase [Candidatus Lokiarchaeum sp. GC14_75]
MKERNIILGIDGIPFELMKSLSEKGIMPNFKDLKRSFYFREMKSSIPHISSVSWSSIITGKNPGEHGIFGFTDLIRGTYTLNYPNFNALKSKTFWHQNHEKTHVIINVPATYPAKNLNGVHIAGFVALDLEKAIFPKKYSYILKKLNYMIDIDSSLAHQQSQDKLFDQLIKVLEIRKKTYQYFWDKLDWHNFMVVITSTDRFGHFLWNTYHNSENIGHSRALQFFQKIDDFIGDLRDRLKEDDNFIILSDHGMEEIKQNMNLNTYLEQENLLKLSNRHKNYNRILEGTKAFVLDPGRVYLNKKGLYPNGSVSKEDEIGVIEELKKIFHELKYKNQKVIKRVHEKHEIYNGALIDKAPDLVVLENPGFNPKGGIGKKIIFEDDDFSGMHNDSAFLFINKDIDLKKPKVEDVVGLIGGNT